MNEKPIIFSGPMVRAIIEGRKTQARRVVKPQPLHQGGDGKWSSSVGPGSNYYWHRYGNEDYLCPYGRPGDLLWVIDTWWDRNRERWRPSIHMPEWACRLWLRVTGVRVERLQEISEGDASREGIAVNHFPRHRVEQFEDLWDSINAKRGYGWDVNPWVWVVEFEKSDASSPA